MHWTRKPKLWRLMPGVHLAQVEEDLVVLDVNADRYLCLRNMASVVTIASPLRIDDADLAAELFDAGLISPAGRARRSEPPAASEGLGAPRASAAPSSTELLRLSDVPEMLRGLHDLARDYRGRPLAAVIASVRRSRVRGAVSDTPAQLEDVVRRFHRWLPYLPVRSKCLVRSFLLLRLLHRHGHDASWVFGVSTWPFRAHCWVQAGDVVLDDDHEHVAGFVPIMVV